MGYGRGVALLSRCARCQGTARTPGSEGGKKLGGTRTVPGPCSLPVLREGSSGGERLFGEASPDCGGTVSNNPRTSVPSIGVENKTHAEPCKSGGVPSWGEG